MTRWKLSIRTWLIGGIIALVVVPYLGTWVAVAALSSIAPARPPVNGPALTAEAMSDLYTAVEGHAERWLDPAWQEEIKGRLDSAAMGVEIQTPAGTFRSFTDVVQSARVDLFRRYVLVGGTMVRTAVVYQGAQKAGEVTWYDLQVRQAAAQEDAWNGMMNTVMPVIVGLLILGTIWGAVVIASRAILKPLGAISRAAEQINRGELDFDVPESGIKELNQFAQAFASMRSGLKESITRQASMEQERRIFIAAMAHDLRTPLTVIRGYLEGLAGGRGWSTPGSGCRTRGRAYHPRTCPWCSSLFTGGIRPGRPVRAGRGWG